MTKARATLIASATLVALACGRPPEGAAGKRLVAEELETPAAPDSGEPSLATGPDGRVFLSWTERRGEAGHALRLAARKNGEQWSTPSTVVEGRGWFVNWADFPAVATLPDGTLYAHWLVKSGPGTYSYDVNVARSVDGGATWSGPAAPHRDGTKTEHGFVSMTPRSAGEMGIVWLDGRKTAGSAHAGDGEGTGEMSLLFTTLGRDGRLGPEAVLDGRVCDCCQTDAARAGEAIVVAYRDRSEAEVRDISVVRFADGRWSAPRPLARDGWEINGCPVNGPAVAAADERVVIAWFTAPAQRSMVKVAFSADGGATFQEPIVVDDGRPLGRVDVVLLDDGSALVSWLEQVERSARVRVVRVAAGGAAEEPLTIAESSGARSSGFPRMTRSGDEVVIAWRDAGEPARVRTAVVRLAGP